MVFSWGASLAHLVSLTIFLSGLWLLLSGHFEPLILWFGVASVLFTVVLAHKMDITDHEGVPLQLGFGIILYWPWLLIEIIKANIDVTKRVLNPSMPISPTLFTLKTSQKTDIGKVLYANSITLTPGTVSVDVLDDEILVHGLSLEAAMDLESGGMDAMATKAEGHK